MKPWDDRAPIFPAAPDAPAAGHGRYGEPFGWWGYHWSPPEPRSLLWLVERGMLDLTLAAFLSLAVEARASLVVVAEPHEAGKTTLLTALLDFLPDETRPIYLRGWYERFGFLDEIPATSGYLLCNEISAHLPTYLWGHGVRRVFQAASDGYPLATTMHANGAADALDQLTAYPLEVPAEHLSALDLVVTIGVGFAGNRLLRRVMRIEALTPSPQGPRITTLAERDTLRGEPRYPLGALIGTLARLGAESDNAVAAALARRVRLFEQWAARGLAQASSLRAEVITSRAP